MKRETRGEGRGRKAVEGLKGIGREAAVLRRQEKLSEDIKETLNKLKRRKRGQTEKKRRGETAEQT